MTRPGTTVLLAAVSAVLLASGCGPSREPAPQPAVAPPAITAEGTLTVGVDLDTPPFAGVDQGRQAGLDIDVGAAIAERLNLAVTYVDVKPSNAATALADRMVDVVLSVPLSDTSLSTLSLAGSYAVDGPAFFVSTGSTASVEPSLTIRALPYVRIAVQRGSPAFWILSEELDQEQLVAFDSLREALQALERGEVAITAGDAFVGGYIAQDIPTVHFAGTLAPPVPLAAAVAPENVELEEAIRSALDALAADGVLDTLRRKWTGRIPELSADVTEETSPTP